MSKVTGCLPSVVADTIMRTIELGVTITDAAVDDDGDDHVVEHQRCRTQPGVRRARRRQLLAPRRSGIVR